MAAATRIRGWRTPLQITRRNFAAGAGTSKYDLVVIGGGSGGLACAKEASELGAKVAVLDFVEPSPKGTKWGLGGTCVNVGCIPKKLMHQAALLGKGLQDAPSFGWGNSLRKGESDFDWATLASGVQGHVRSLNWGHRVQLNEKNVTYLNAKGSFVDANTVEAVSADGTKKHLLTDNVVIAVGMRPRYLNMVPGMSSHAISSDDLFWKSSPPGNTLVIGGSYVALECAGFLTGMGYSASVMVRSICLRGFDQQMAGHVRADMEEEGTAFIDGSIPLAVTQKSGDEKLTVSWASVDSPTVEQGRGEFESILLAIGRDPQTTDLGLSRVGVETSEAGRVLGGYGGATEQTTVSNIYALGDVLNGVPELTPAAIRAGKLLARRLYSSSNSLMMDYTNVATTVFTPLEYACVGLSEEDGIRLLGEDGVEVYHAHYKPLEYTVSGRSYENCYIKVICDKPSGKVLGIHLTSPSAGEIMQGFSVALRCGLTMDTLWSTVGIHPTIAEELVKVHISKRSGLDPAVSGC